MLVKAFYQGGRLASTMSITAMADALSAIEGDRILGGVLLCANHRLSFRDIALRLTPAADYSMKRLTGVITSLLPEDPFVVGILTHGKSETLQTSYRLDRLGPAHTQSFVLNENMTTQVILSLGMTPRVLPIKVSQGEFLTRVLLELLGSPTVPTHLHVLGSDRVSHAIVLEDVISTLDLVTEEAFHGHRSL